MVLSILEIRLGVLVLPFGVLQDGFLSLKSGSTDAGGAGELFVLAGAAGQSGVNVFGVVVDGDSDAVTHPFFVLLARNLPIISALRTYYWPINVHTEQIYLPPLEQALLFRAVRD